MDLDLACVVSFTALCEEGHFGRAAARLHVTTPALSKRIQKLERQLGVRLLERTAPGETALTAAGWRFAEHAPNLLARARSAQVAAQEAARVPVHTVVRIGVPGTPSSDAMMRRVVAPLKSARERLPGVRLRVVGLPYDALLEAVVLGSVDVLWSPSPLHHPALVSKVVATIDRVGVVARTHDLAGVDATSAERFAELPLLHSASLPTEIMNPGCLGDVRPLSEAHLVPTSALTFAQLRAEITGGRGVAVVPDVLAVGLGPALHSVRLEGLDAAALFAVYRRRDEGRLLLQVVRLMASS